MRLRRQAEARDAAQRTGRRRTLPKPSDWYDAEALLGVWERDDGASDDPAAMHELLQLTWAQRQAQSHASQARGVSAAAPLRSRADARRARVARSW